MQETTSLCTNYYIIITKKFSHRLDDLDQTDPVLKKYSLPKLTQKRKIGNPNHPIFIEDFESITNLPKQKTVFSNRFTGEFSQIFKVEIFTLISNIFQNIGAHGVILSESFYQTKNSIVLIFKLDKDIKVTGLGM